MDVVDLENGASDKKGFTEDDIFQHGDWVIEQIETFLGMTVRSRECTYSHLTHRTLVAGSMACLDAQAM
jgi:hypothetical protein